MIDTEFNIIAIEIRRTFEGMLISYRSPRKATGFLLDERMKWDERHVRYMDRAGSARNDADRKRWQDQAFISLKVVNYISTLFQEYFPLLR